MPQSDLVRKIRLLNYLEARSGEWFSRLELHRELHLPHVVLNRLLQTLESEGLVRSGEFYPRYGSKGRGTTTRYRATTVKERVARVREEVAATV